MSVLTMIESYKPNSSHIICRRTNRELSGDLFLLASLVDKGQQDNVGQ